MQRSSRQSTGSTGEKQKITIHMGNVSITKSNVSMYEFPVCLLYKLIYSVSMNPMWFTMKIYQTQYIYPRCLVLAVHNKQNLTHMKLSTTLTTRADSALWANREVYWLGYLIFSTHYFCDSCSLRHIKDLCWSLLILYNVYRYGPDDYGFS